MNLKNALATTEGARRLILVQAAAIVLLIICLVILSTKVGDEEIVVRMLPPIPTIEEMTVSGRNMSASYAENWGMFVASQLGNISAETAEEAMGAISRVLSREVQEQLRESVTASIQTMRIQGFRLHYRPDTSRYDPKSGLVHVTGALTEIPFRGEPVTVTFTYEMRIGLRYGLPSITEFRSYEGRPEDQEAGR